MRANRPISITLPLDMAEMVKAKVASGEYTTDSEVIRDGLRTLQARDAAVEEWLRDKVAESYDKHRANPLSAVRGEDMMPRLRAARGTRAPKPGV